MTIAFLHAAVGRLTLRKQRRGMLLCSWCMGMSSRSKKSAGSTHLHLDEPCAHAFLSKGADDDKIGG